MSCPKSILGYMSCFNTYVNNVISGAVKRRWTEVARRMTELEEHTQNLHAELDPKLTKVSRDIPNVLINLLSSAFQLHNEISIRWHKDYITLNQLFRESSQKGWKSIKG